MNVKFNIWFFMSDKALVIFNKKVKTKELHLLYRMCHWSNICPAFSLIFLEKLD